MCIDDWLEKKEGMIFYNDAVWVTVQNTGVVYCSRQLKKMFMSRRENDETIFWHVNYEISMNINLELVNFNWIFESGTQGWDLDKWYRFEWHQRIGYSQLFDCIEWERKSNIGQTLRNSWNKKVFFFFFISKRLKYYIEKLFSRKVFIEIKGGKSYTVKGIENHCCCRGIKLL